MKYAEYLNENDTMFLEGFPEALQDNVMDVLFSIHVQMPAGSYDPMPSWRKPQQEWYALSTGESVSFPYRVYDLYGPPPTQGFGDPDGERIYHCIMTRSSDGWIRERHLKQLLDKSLPEWCFPYLLKLSSEYVIEILNVLYDGLKDRDNTDLQRFCQNNPAMLKKSYARMVSYWNEYYRGDVWKLENYVGCKLFRECFAPNVDIERL